MLNNPTKISVLLIRFAQNRTARSHRSTRSGVQCLGVARALLQILGEGPVRLKKNTNVLASELETLPEELREALGATVREAGQPPPVNRKLHLAIWCQKVMRKAQDEIDRLFGI